MSVKSGGTLTVLYTIAHAQQNAIHFNSAKGNVSVPSLWTSYFSSDSSMVEWFYKDYSTNDGRLDHAIAVDSLAAGGQNYLTITSLSARQAFAGTQLCGTPSKPYLFLKEISSDGNIQVSSNFSLKTFHFVRYITQIRSTMRVSAFSSNDQI